MTDAKESMKMLLQIIETHSIEGAERYTGRLIDLLNSDETREFLAEKLRAARSVIEEMLSHLNILSGNVTRMQDAVVKKLLEFQRLLQGSFYESVKCLRDIARLLEDRGSSDHEIMEIRRLITGSDALDIFSIADVVLSPNSAYFVLMKASPILDDVSLSDREKITKLWNGIKEDESFENFEATARGNVRNVKGRDGKPMQRKVLEEFDDGVKQCKIGMEDLLSSVHDNVSELSEKLTTAQTSAVSHTKAYLARHTPILKNFDVFGGQGRRFKNRQNPVWFEHTEEFLFEYIRGGKTDEELQKFILTEELEADIEQIHNSLGVWIKNTLSSVRRWKIPTKSWQIPKEVPMINKESVIAEIKREWAFTKALLLEDKANIDLHSQLLNEVISKACTARNGVAPVISLGRMPDGGKQLKLRFVCGQNANISEIKRLVDDIAGLTNGRSVGENRSIDGREVEFQVVFSENQEHNVRGFMQRLVTKMAELAELHVRIAMLGNFDVSSGARLTNPAFNRTYGDGWSAPGFMPTGDFGFLDYSGEKYFCPKGWRRISINVASSAAEFDRKYGGWHVAYHGTNHELAATILTSGFIARIDKNSSGEAVVFFSPSIEYAGHPYYSRTYEVTGNNGEKQYMQMVLQVRVNPACVWQKIGGTVPGAMTPDCGGYDKERDKSTGDPNFPGNENLEWTVKPLAGTSGVDQFNGVFVIYGIMIRSSDRNLAELPQNAWWKKFDM